jgi:transcriptional regulator with XRE-family HTH domain/tetratricopeptide (TPR) repeat protein
MLVKRARFSARRRIVGFSQEQLAERLKVDRSTVARWEAGEAEPQPWLRPRIARALQISVEQLDDLLAKADQVGAEAGTDRLDSAPTHSAFQLVPVGVGALNDPDVVTMQAFRSADLQVGGGHLYASVVKYLHADVAPRVFGTDDSAGNGAVFTAAGALTEMAGWMAHDAGRDDAARQHFDRARALAGVDGDRQLGAHVLGSLSHLASYRGQAEEAVQLARQGQSALGAGRANPGLKARLLALEARGVAGQAGKDGPACAQLLAEAEQALSGTPDEAPSPWVSRFDEGSLASEAARCMRQLGDLSEAQRQAERVIALRPSHRTRSRAFGQMALASVLVAKGKPDEACGIAHEVLTATQSLGSYLVILRLIELRHLLQPYRLNPVVAGFLGNLEATLQDRMWLYQWLSRQQRSQPFSNREQP